MTPDALAFLGLTAIVGSLVAVLTFAVLRIFAAARSPVLRERGADASLLAAALQEAVTKLKAQERAMELRAEASERLSEEIIASLSSGLLVVSLDGKVQIVNPVGRRLLGLGAGQHQGADYGDVLSHAAPVAALIAQCLKSGQPSVRRSIEMPAGPAGTLKLGASVSPLFGAASEVQGAICLFTDLTAVVALEEQLRLKDSLARVGELTAGIAHEFRNGLATIHGYSRLLDLEALPPAFRTYVEGIRAETEAMREVVTNFLNFARPTQLTLSPVDLRAVAQRAAEDLQGGRAGAARRDHGERRVRDHRRRRRAAAPGIQQPAAQRDRSLRCRRIAAGRRHPLRGRSLGGREHAVDLRQRPGLP